MIENVEDYEPIDEKVTRRLLIGYIYQNQFDCAPRNDPNDHDVPPLDHWDGSNGIVSKVRDLYLKIHPYKHNDPKKLNSEKTSLRETIRGSCKIRKYYLLNKYFLKYLLLY